MKNVALIFWLSLFFKIASAQPLQTLFHKDSTRIPSLKGYGEMFIKGTGLKNEPTLIIGGRGGFIFNRKIAFGGVGAGYLMRTHFKGNDLTGNTNADLRLRMGSGGVFFEYIHKMEAPVHFSFPISFTVGNIEVTNSLSGNRVESSRLLMIEPGINIDFNFTKILIISLTGSYRIGKLNDLTNLTNADVSGLVVGLTGRFASF